MAGRIGQKRLEQLSVGEVADEIVVGGEKVEIG